MITFIVVDALERVKQTAHSRFQERLAKQSHIWNPSRVVDRFPWSRHVHSLATALRWHEGLIAADILLLIVHDL
jgi:hypothetical protein